MATAKKNNDSIGLVLGKFAPLHKGHQLLIETARREMDRVKVMIYNCPETTNIPLNVRSGWIKKLYPDVEVIEAWDGPTETGRAAWIKKKNEDYVLKKINEPISAFYSSEWYGDHMSKFLNCANIMVDRPRQNFNVSGTRVRNNSYRYRKYLDPIVYNDYLISVVLLGAESSGKTTLTKALAKKYKTVWLPEYGREYWEKNQQNGLLTHNQLVELAIEHRHREYELIMKAKIFLFIDTNAMTTALFDEYYHGEIDSRLQKMANEDAERQNIFLLCDIDIPYEDDGSRSGAEHRIKFARRIEEDLQAKKVSYYKIRGTLEQRLKQVKKILNRIDIY